MKLYTIDMIAFDNPLLFIAYPTVRDAYKALLSIGTPNVPLNFIEESVASEGGEYIVDVLIKDRREMVRIRELTLLDEEHTIKAYNGGNDD